MNQISQYKTHQSVRKIFQGFVPYFSFFSFRIRLSDPGSSDLKATGIENQVLLIRTYFLRTFFVQVNFLRWLGLNWLGVGSRSAGIVDSVGTTGRS